MNRLDLIDARCEALFVSGLQRSDRPGTAAVVAAIRRSVRQFGVSGCAARMAQEFGEHPEAAVERMRWVRQVVDRAFPVSARRAADAAAPGVAPVGAPTGARTGAPVGAGGVPRAA
jgi:hypothetical protein